MKECNTIIAILKNIEKTQLKPTLALVTLLYEAIKEEERKAKENKQARMLEKMRFNKDDFILGED